MSTDPLKRCAFGVNHSLGLLLIHAKTFSIDHTCSEAFKLYFKPSRLASVTN